MTKKTSEFALNELELGKPTEYLDQYDPSLLQPVPRSLNRAELGITARQPFFGCDVWHGYELSWLNSKGKPVVALMRCTVPFDSPNIVESKSFKLYLNSFNQTKFAAEQDVAVALKRDLSKVAGSLVEIELFGPGDNTSFNSDDLPGACLDELDIELENYSLEPELLCSSIRSRETVSDCVHSHLLKSNCLITNQPDWASVIIEYRGHAIPHDALLKYLVSFRQHNEFHEQCVERIFMDLTQAFELQELSVQALYTRRGGLDINPYRTTQQGTLPPLRRINRQ